MARLKDDQFDAELCERADQIVRQILSIGPQEGQGRVDIIELFLEGRVVYMCGGDAKLEKCVTGYLRKRHSHARRALAGFEPEAVLHWPPEWRPRKRRR
jgi:hypothetical protein